MIMIYHVSHVSVFFQAGLSRDFRQAGPCHNYEALVTLEHAKTLQQDFEDVKSQDDVDAVWKKLKTYGGQWDELMAACKTASAELRKASDAAHGGSKAKAKGKAKPKPGAKVKGKKGPLMYQVFEADCLSMIPTYDAYPVPDSHNMRFPFILRKSGLPQFLKSIVEKDASEQVAKVALDEVEGFKKLFAQSDLRFTAGKAQSTIKDPNDQVSTAMYEAVVGIERLDLLPLQPVACFGSMEKHRSLQFEVGGLGSLRLSIEGCSGSECFKSGGNSQKVLLRFKIF